MGALFTADTAQETLDAFVANSTAVLAKYDARWADGRVHCAGASITAADYTLLADFTAMFTNTGLKNPSIQPRLLELYNASPNYKRVVDSIKGELQATVDALQPTWI